MKTTEELNKDIEEYDKFLAAHHAIKNNAIPTILNIPNTKIIIGKEHTIITSILNTDEVISAFADMIHKIK